MIRRVIVALLRFALRIYFRRIEVTGLEHVPHDDPVIFVLNHPNALVDPVFLLCLAPRQVSFLAKAPLFRYPVIGYLVKELDSLPVYRRQDEGEDITARLASARKVFPMTNRDYDRSKPAPRVFLSPPSQRAKSRT
jgi:1-acyl-sn-glycerol-3-phosphate acyltransferase